MKDIINNYNEYEEFNEELDKKHIDVVIYGEEEPEEYIDEDFDEEYYDDSDEDFDEELDSQTSAGENSQVLYSEKAKEDGFDFSSLTAREQIMTRALYVSERAISDFALIKNRLSYVHSYGCKYGWGIPVDGYHYGYVVDCGHSSSYPEYNILRLQVTGCDIRSFKFSQSSFDNVCAAIERYFHVSGSVFRIADYDFLIGQLVLLKVKNTKTEKGGYYSNIEDICLLDAESERTLLKMVSIMYEQAKPMEC